MISQTRRLSLTLTLGLVAVGSQAQNPAVTVQVNATAGRHPINPNVYGLAYASRSVLTDLNVPFNRWGGNNTSRYNWLQNADNRGSDWYFQSVPYGSATAGAEADAFIDDTFGGGAQVGMTVPTVGWVAKLGAQRSKLSSFSISKYGPQTDADWTWFPDAGNGVRTTGGYVVGNDKTDANVPADALFQKAWIQHIAQRSGSAATGGVRYYVLDNEPSIWFATHRDVHPEGARMAEIRDKFVDYSARIKEADPSALIVGPEEWGWTGYFYSGYDQQYAAAHGWGNFPDRVANGGADYLPWLLQQLRQHEVNTGRRALDVFTVHYYPQGGEYGSDVSTAMKLRRNRSTRSLWDPNYVDETWVADKVRLIPRLAQWVADHYPGLPIGITEYNWGAEDDMNGATAQADVLGIFGREKLDLAARWTTPAASTPTYKAIKIYRNYDGNRSTFGDVSIAASVPNPDNVSSFAAVRSVDGALTVMVVAKQLSGTTPITVALTGFTPGGPAQVWQLDSATGNITRRADVATSASGFGTSVPSPSVTLFVVPSAAPARLRGDFNADRQADLLWQHANGQLQIWTMDGTKRTAVSATTPAAESEPNWRVAATPDINGDGKSDILWRHALTGALRLWTMNGSVRTGVLTPTPASVPDLNWRVAASGDFNADGKPDILWRHALSGRNVVWLMDGATRLSGQFLTPDTVADTGWQMAGAADFNSDGKPDIVWRHVVSGKAVVWLMDGTTRISGLFPTPAGLSDANWQLASVADFDDDGQPDLLWHHATSGKNVAWLMNGLTRTFGLLTTPDAQPDTAWALMGPR
jgi:hypothetical protein